MTFSRSGWDAGIHLSTIPCKLDPLHTLWALDLMCAWLILSPGKASSNCCLCDLSSISEYFHQIFRLFAVVLNVAPGSWFKIS